MQTKCPQDAVARLASADAMGASMSKTCWSVRSSRCQTKWSKRSIAHPELHGVLPLPSDKGQIENQRTQINWMHASLPYSYTPHAQWHQEQSDPLVVATSCSCYCWTQASQEESDTRAASHGIATSSFNAVPRKRCSSWNMCSHMGVNQERCRKGDARMESQGATNLLNKHYSHYMCNFH